jgi:hypothetical protein
MALSRIDTTNMIEDVPQSKIDNNINFRNLIINGDMSIAQRATSTSGVTTSDGYYACDRFYTQTDIGTWTISQATDTPSGQGFSNSLKLDCTSAGTSNADEVMIRYKIEGQNLQYLKYGTSSAESLTLSFWIKSNKTGTYSLAIVNDPTAGARVVSFAYTIDSANTWEKKIITIPGDTASSIDNTNGEEFVLYFLFSAASNFTSGGGVSNTWIDYAANRFAPSNLAGLGGSTSDEVYMTGVQLEAGTTASDFEFLPHDVNLNRCLRYYSHTFDYGTAYDTSTNDGAIGFVGEGNITNRKITYFYPKEMRTVPSITFTQSSIDNGGSISTSELGAKSTRINTSANGRYFRTHLKCEAEL